jgi:hypothetical protein
LCRQIPIGLYVRPLIGLRIAVIPQRWPARRVLHEGTDAPAFAEEGDKVVVPAVVTPRPGKAMRKDAALQMLGKRFAKKGLEVWWSHCPSNWPEQASSKHVS